MSGLVTIIYLLTHPPHVDGVRSTLTHIPTYMKTIMFDCDVFNSFLLKNVATHSVLIWMGENIVHRTQSLELLFGKTIIFPNPSVPAKF